MPEPGRPAARWPVPRISVRGLSSRRAGLNPRVRSPRVQGTPRGSRGPWRWRGWRSAPGELATGTGPRGARRTWPGLPAGGGSPGAPACVLVTYARPSVVRVRSVRLSHVCAPRPHEPTRVSQWPVTVLPGRPALRGLGGTQRRASSSSDEETVLAMRREAAPPTPDTQLASPGRLVPGVGAPPWACRARLPPTGSWLPPWPCTCARGSPCQLSPCTSAAGAPCATVKGTVGPCPRGPREHPLQGSRAFGSDGGELVGPRGGQSHRDRPQRPARLGLAGVAGAGSGPSVSGGCPRPPRPRRVWRPS